MRKILSSPFFAALLGGAIVAAAMLIAGVGSKTYRTIVEPTALGTQTTSSGQPAWGAIYQRDAPGVVYITATVVQQAYSPFDPFPSTTEGTNTGSGFVINRSGVILTNNHVIAGAVKITVAFADNQTVTAKVIGINSQIETGGGSGSGSVGIGFAIPINTAVAVIPQIERTGKVIQGFLGITTTTVDPSLSPLHLHVSYGALIQTVQSPSPAARAGLRAGNLLVTLADGVTQVYSGGDVIVSLDGERIASATALENAIVADRPGQLVKVGIVRGTRHLTVDVRLGTRPDALPVSG
jgi:S1-C subfamily serine protease